MRAHCASGAIAPAKGATTSSCISRKPRQSTIAQSRAVPARYAATRSSGATVAESPTRRSGTRVSSSSDSSSSARCAPRLLPASACTSSMITVSTWVSLARYESIATISASDSGVVSSTCGGRLIIKRRSSTGVSPVRTPVRTNSSRTRPRRRFARSVFGRSRIPISRSGRRRLCSTS